MNSKLTPLLLVLAALALALGPNPAMASVSVWVTPTGTTGGDGAEGASAQFTSSTNQLTVTLTNTLAANLFRAPGQALSDITFTLSNATTATNFTGSTAAGQFGDVSGSTVTYVSSDDKTGNTTPVRWFANGSVSGTTVTLETIGGGQPSQMIAPFVSNSPPGGQYPSANGGLDNFNSYVIGPATFTLNLPGVTAATTVTAATFSFGTTPDMPFITGIPQVIPEPSTMIMAALGAVGFLGYGVRRRPKT
jgi:hypothetical protein